MRQKICIVVLFVAFYAFIGHAVLAQTPTETPTPTPTTADGTPTVAAETPTETPSPTTAVTNTVVPTTLPASGLGTTVAPTAVTVIYKTALPEAGTADIFIVIGAVGLVFGGIGFYLTRMKR